jgi:pyruvate dehydrogenase E2 component (dihydrolipoamide acetyltransferase)
LLLASGEEPPPENEQGTAIEPEAAPAKPSPTKETKKESLARPQSDAPPKTSSASNQGEGRVRISPLARKIAQEKGIDIGRLTGSGPAGRIVARDIEQAGTRPAAVSSPKSPTTVGVAPVPAGVNDQRIPLSGMRRIIAERLVASKATIPHFYLHVEVDAGALMKLRAEVKATAEASGGPKFTINDFVLKAVVAAVAKVPAVNASFDGDAIIHYGSVNLAVAVAVEDGLVTPVIRDAQKKSLREISEAVKDLATRARSKKLKPEEFQGGTVTVSNLGSYGIDAFFAIINPPQSLIVSVGAIVKKPVVGADDQIVVGQRMSVGLSADHRVVDGAIGAQYLSEVRRHIENPALMLF